MAMTPTLVNGICYADVATAKHAYFSSIPVFVTPGVTSYMNWFQPVSAGGVWSMAQYSISSTGVWTLRSNTTAPVPTFADCDATVTFTDGMTIGWGVVAAMAAAAALILLKRAVP